MFHSRRKTLSDILVKEEGPSHAVDGRKTLANLQVNPLQVNQWKWYGNRNMTIYRRQTDDIDVTRQ